MKRLILLIAIILSVGILSCDKKDLINGPDELPSWLKLKIAELVPEQNLCNITTVTIIEYNGKKYYYLYCMIWSCAWCHLFDEQGNRPAWTTCQWDDFFAGKKDVQTVPACK